MSEYYEGGLEEGKFQGFGEAKLIIRRWIFNQSSSCRDDFFLGELLTFIDELEAE